MCVSVKKKHTRAPHGIFACASLAVIRAGRQQAGVEEQECNSAAPCGKWKDVTAPLGLSLLNAKHLLISSNFAANAFVFVCMYICQREMETEKYP